MERKHLENLVERYRGLDLSLHEAVSEYKEEEDALPWNLPFINVKGKVDYMTPGSKVHSFDRNKRKVLYKKVQTAGGSDYIG